MNEDQEKTVLENENLIYMVLKRYNLYKNHEEYYDLGMIGLVKGAKTYDCSRNIKLSTYLTRCIENEIKMFLRKKRPQTISFDSVIFKNDRSKITIEDTLADESTDVEYESFNNINFESINNIIKEMSEREQLIINHLFNINGCKRLNQFEIAKMMDISQAQVSRIKDKILSDIRKKMNEDGI